MSETQFHTNLARRLAQPSIIFWIGSDFVEQELERDLQHLPVLALFLETQVESLEQALRAGGSVRGRWPLTLHTHDEVDAWLPPQPVVFYLRGLAHDDLPRARRAALRAHMARSFERLVEYRPIVVTLGMEAGLGEVVDTVHGFDPATPLIVLGDETSNRARIEQLTVDGHDVGAVTFARSWAQFSERLEASGFSLRSTDETPGILIGEHRVPLYEVFKDPELRIDDRWRIITTRALNPPSSAELDQLFESFMRPDERDQAASVETDVNEWWAVASKIPFLRPVATSVESTVLAKLAAIESGREAESVHTCWLPAESGSGATSLLHIVAFAAARAGHPTLVLKQLARDVSANALQEFLTSVHSQRTRAAVESDRPPPRERCALIVLDIDHAGAESIEELPRFLRGSGRQALILWAARINAEDLAKRLPSDPDKLREFYQRAFVDLRAPSVIDKSATFLPPLRAQIEDEELLRLQAHVTGLRARGVRLHERDSGSWVAFQRRNDYWRAPVDREVPPDERKHYEAFFRAEDLFWALLYHFLRWPNESPFDTAIQGRFKELLAANPNGAISEESWLRGALLLEIAKVSSCGLVIPQSILADWLGAVRKTRSSENSTRAAPPKAVTLAASSALSYDHLSASIERLRQRFAGGMPERGPRALAPDAHIRQLLDDLEYRGFIRTSAFRGHVEVRFIHRQLARAVLLSAITLSGVPDDMKLAAGGATVLDPDRRFGGFRALLQCVGFTESNLRFLHTLSEAVLLGDEDWPGWRNALGEGRLACYDLIPNAVRKQSRVLLHHHAVVLKRTTFSTKMPARTQRLRLLDAKKLCEEALALPWSLGVRDEHPGHILTSLGLILRSLARTVPSEAQVWEQEARERLTEALVELPASRHPRFALARMLVTEAQAIKRTQPERAADLASQALAHLSIAPTGRELNWYKVKEEAYSVFGDDRGRELLADLRGRGIEAGFLLSAELACKDQNLIGAIELLQPIVAGELALRNVQAARRLAELLALDPLHRGDFDERYRLLRAVEEARPRLTPDEEFQLAWLEYQRGDYRAGGSRFNIFRSTQRHRDLVAKEHPYLMNPKTRHPIELTGAVESIEGLRGWMRISSADGSKLFSVPFYRRHFIDENLVVGRHFKVHVRFEGNGPRAVSLRFQRGPQS